MDGEILIVNEYDVGSPGLRGSGDRNKFRYQGLDLEGEKYIVESESFLNGVAIGDYGKTKVYEVISPDREDGKINAREIEDNSLKEMVLEEFLDLISS